SGTLSLRRESQNNTVLLIWLHCSDKKISVRIKRNAERVNKPGGKRGTRSIRSELEDPARCIICDKQVARGVEGEPFGCIPSQGRDANRREGAEKPGNGNYYKDFSCHSVQVDGEGDFYVRRRLNAAPWLPMPAASFLQHRGFEAQA